MANRLTGLLTLAAMLLANGVLFREEILPALLAGPAPRGDFEALDPGEQVVTQTRILDDQSEVVGRSWTQATRSEQALTIRTVTVLHGLRVGGFDVPTFAVEMDSTWLNAQNPQEFTARLRGLELGGEPMIVRLDAEYSFGRLAGRWQVGPIKNQFDVDASTVGQLGSTFAPFARLRGLYVGRTWRTQVFDPVNALLPGQSEGGLRMDGKLVRVTAREFVADPITNTELEAFRVESDDLVAWVDDDGSVLRATMRSPIGTLTAEVEEVNNLLFLGYNEALTNPEVAELLFGQ